MTPEILLQKPETLTIHARQLSRDEVGILITLFRLTDKWPTGAASTELQRSHAHVLRLHLASLFEYYYDLGQENKAKLATTIHAATFYAEKAGLTHAQIAAIQTLFTYFQRIALTTDDLRTCSRLLWENGIDTAPEMPNWQAAIQNYELRVTNYVRPADRAVTRNS